MPIKHRILPDIISKDVDRFWSKVVMLPSGCWEWQGKRGRGGYGSFHIQENKTERSCIASRVAYKIYYTIDPLDLCVCHTCDNPRCVNPFHLFLGTTQDNNRDKFLKGHYHSGDDNWTRKHPERLLRGDNHPRRKHPERWASGKDSHLWGNPLVWGETHPDAKLTDAIVKECRQRYANGGISYAKLGKEFGVCKQVMIAAVKGRTWKHI